jgi:hypothetical protein
MNILRTSLTNDYTLCQQLWLNVFSKDGYEIKQWIEKNQDKKHFELDQIVEELGGNEIEQRKKINYAPKSLAGVCKLLELNKIKL